MTQPTFTRSWVASANGHTDFPLQNLPLGVFSRPGSAPRSGVAIGEHIFDLQAALEAGLFDGAAKAAVEACQGGQLNAFFALGRAARVALRERLMDLLGEGSSLRGQVETLGKNVLALAADCVMHLPAKINDYTDFYVGIEHARNVGKLFRPDNPLLPNYKYLPIGYHGRASTIRPSGTDVRRPWGQTLPAGQSEPVFGPCARLDYELELGIWIGQGNAMGDSIAIADAADHVAGFCLLNDWSARDVQAWEYQPLGPFLSKSFITSISPWVVTAEALAPFRQAQPPRPVGDPPLLSYLSDPLDQATGAFDIELEALLLTESMREQQLPPQRLTLSNTRHMYWTVAQMIAHHSVNGCQLQAGDLFGSGTLSGPEAGQFGSLLEITEGGKKPLELASGEMRRFLEEGDEIILRARCHREGFASIGFGECRGKILPAR
ncbi:fumarylacetoacetase [Pseudomonas agarici]|uniref:fumarylacetoacetase n=1 Tax=Pseudomonas agarici TaxID=46677 RepID=A0A0X1SXZ0_PSEAA|nr:fumarylacetoacetase [Pseudomonas agarici]AMB84399.1 fumarylacetoacetase [Pseudomonas agarici]NWB89594.1 fumarylacetoacetase [Pseudomonas agarici]NWC10345.1 fumarylacetoacetase [Pseudomonas agarici]SEK21660.1 fumarylacetoacetate hydrolase [Pseudomonas agarici]